MKNIVIFAIVLMTFASCSKEPVGCSGPTVTCNHKVGIAYVVCPDPEDSTKLKFSDPQFSIQTDEISVCDTTAWLSEARKFDAEQLQYDPSVPTWNQFSKLYPNECGCK